MILRFLTRKERLQMAAYIFVPWMRGDEAQEFIDKSNEWNSVKRILMRSQLTWDLDDAEADPRWNQQKFTIVCYGDQVTFANLSQGDQIYVRGHGRSDSNFITGDGMGRFPLNVEQVCERLTKQGLANFTGKIKFYNCESGQSGGKFNTNFARSAAKILSQTNPRCKIYGYKESVSSYYEEGKDGVHKRGKISGKRASDPTIREQVFGSKSS
jgi:hypothetical protein